MSHKLAAFTSNLINPFLVGLALIVLVSFKAAGSAAEGLKWALLISSLSILPILVMTLIQLRRKKLDNFFISNRRQRYRIYFFTGLCTVAGFAILLALGAPDILLVTFVASLLIVITFALINLRWKISVHSAWAAASVTVLISLYGWMLAPTMVLVPLTAWARIKTGQHSLAQTAAGSALAAVIAFGVFTLSGVV